MPRLWVYVRFLKNFCGGVARVACLAIYMYVYVAQKRGDACMRMYMCMCTYLYARMVRAARARTLKSTRRSAKRNELGSHH